MKWPSPKEEVVIRLLAQGETHGYELAQKSKGELKVGTVYVTLGRMVEKGYLTSRLEMRSLGTAGSPYRFYALTPLGCNILQILKFFTEGA